MKNHGISFRVFVSILFLGFVFFLFPFVSKYFDASDAHNVALTFLKNEPSTESKAIDLYGLSQRLFGKHTIENFSIQLDSNGKLQKPYEALVTYEEAIERVHNISRIIDYCNNNEVPVLYIRNLLPIMDSNDVPYDGCDHSRDNYAIFSAVFSQARVPTIDIKEFEGIKTIQKNELFYRTDHHWTTKSAFETFFLIIDYLNKQYGYNNESLSLDADSFDEIKYPNCFLGSYGIKVGQYFAGKDDFVVYIPKFETSFKFTGFDQKHEIVIEKNGPWFECLMDQDKLNDPGYNNKHASWTNAQSVEYSIINDLTKSSKKLLLISHSYGRPLAQYLSLCFKEVRQLDPQRGRFSGNYLDYIDEYQPDIVLFLVEFEGDLIGEYNTER